MLSSFFIKGKLQALKKLLEQRLPNVDQLLLLNDKIANELVGSVGLALHNYQVLSVFAKHLEYKSMLVSATDDKLPQLVASLRNLSNRALAQQALNSLKQIAIAHFERSLTQMMRSGWVDKEERQKLVEICYRAGLSQSEVETLYTQLTSPFIEPFVKEAVAGGLYSPQDQARLEKLAADLGVDQINLSPSQNPTLAQARKRWDMINGPMPVVDSPLMLEPGEICHAAIRARAYEPRTRTVRVNYHGPAARIRIAKGVSYNLASYSVGREVETYTYPVGDGWLVLTNKRLIFAGNLKTVSVPLNKIVDWTFFSDAVEIKRATGKPITFVNAPAIKHFQDVLTAARSKLIR